MSKNTRLKGKVATEKAGKNVIDKLAGIVKIDKRTAKHFPQEEKGYTYVGKHYKFS